MFVLTLILYLLRRAKIVFNALGEEDIGIYSCLVTHTDGASSSYSLSNEGGFNTCGMILLK